MGHLLYLMFRCDFDVMENLKSLEKFGRSKHTPSVQIDGSMSVRKRDMAHSKLGVDEKHPYPYKQSHHNLLFIK